MSNSAVASVVVALLVGVASCTLWPWPEDYTPGSTDVQIYQYFELDCSVATGFNCTQTLKNALSRYTPLVKQTASCADASSCLASCMVQVEATDDEHLDHTTDESYTLSITTDSQPECLITANTVYGAIHAFETLVQIASPRPGWVSQVPVKITDSPRFPFRSLLIDTSRHFLPVSFIEHIIDTLAMNKMNILHWHIVDSQSFPADSNVYPLLAEKGAWQPGVMYSVSQMTYLVEYARERGVRIMIEFDVPGHGSWGMAYPNLMACSDVLDPTQQSVYSFLKNFLLDMGSIFPDEYLFLGGDEVELSCFDSNPSIVQWMAQNNMTSSQLQQYFWQQMTAQVLPSLHKTVVIWEDSSIQISPSNVPTGTVINAYQSKSTLKALADMQVSGVLSAPWYLDQENPDGCEDYAWQQVWECMYNEDPYWSGITPQEEQYVLGGEACMWGEGINQAVFDERVWPRASAVAERLWSPQGTNTNAQNRLVEHTCRMNMRGVRAGPIVPGFCPYDATNTV